MPEVDQATFATFIRAHANDKAEKLTDKKLQALYLDYGPGAWSLPDQGYIARVHPLELWLLGYLIENPQATFKDAVAASAEERQEVYGWLFKTRHKSARDSRIRTLLEVEAFLDIHQRWKRLGYPFEHLVPSLATAIGSSGDRPAALAELMTSADLAFGACGTATWERCILGLPAIVVVLADNQREPTQALVDAGVVLSLGEVGGLTAGDIADAVDRLTANPALCRDMSAKARAIMHTDDAPIEDILGGDLPFVFEDLQLRFAVQTDAPNLLAWRNQEDVRVHSRSQEIIGLAKHADWLATVIGDPARHLQIGYRDGKPIGVVRLDECDGTGEVSIYLTPDARGQNNGSALLRAQEAWIRATRPAIQRLIAVVLDTNDTSHRLFLKNGYTRLPTHYEKRITR